MKEMSPQEIAAHIITFIDLDPAALDQALEALRPQLSLEVMRALGALAYTAQNRQAPEGLRIAHLSQKVADLIEDEEARYLGMLYQGNACVALNQYQEALTHFEEVEKYYLTSDKDPIHAAGIQINQIAVLRNLGEYVKALAIENQARAICEFVQGEKAELYSAILDTNVGWIHEEMGDFEKALATYEHGREIYIKHRQFDRLAKIDLNRAHLLQMMNRFTEAEASLNEIRKIFVESGRKTNIARTDWNLGEVVFRQGQYQLALKYLDQALNGFAAIPLPVEVACVNLSRLPVYLKLNLIAEMTRLAAEVETIFRQNRMHRERILCLYYQGIGFARLGRPDKAEKRLTIARRLLRQQEAWYKLWLVDTERAELALQAGRPATARRIAQRVRKQLPADQNPALAARLNLVLARCHFASPTPDWAAARQLTEQALQIAADAFLYEIQIHGHHWLAQILALAGEEALAWQSLQQAVRKCEFVRAHLLLDEFQLGFLEDVKAVYTDSVRGATQLVQQGKLAPAHLLFYLNQAQKAPFLEPASPSNGEGREDGEASRKQLTALRQTWHWHHHQLTEPNAQDKVVDVNPIKQALARVETEIAELRRRVRVRGTPPPGQVSYQETTPEALAPALQERMRSEEALLHLFEVSGKLQGLLITTTSCQLLADLAAVTPLQQQLNAWHFYVQHGHLGEHTKDAPLAHLHLTRFYQLLWQPLQPHLQDKKSLILVLPAQWQELPVAAFFDGRHYVVERWQITYLTSLEAFLSKTREAETTTDMSPREAWICAYSEGGQVPHTITEAKAVSAALGDGWQTRLVVEADLTRQRLAQAAGAAHLLHLATHAVFRPDNPLFSWLALADARLMVADFYEFPLRQRPLVVLSGCETGRGQPHGGGLLGLGRTLLSAGAAELILTLWRIEDESSARLMVAFYEALAPTAFSWRHVGSAIRVAQLTAVAAGWSPFDWAGYTFLAG